jgi:hypothetical protein
MSLNPLNDISKVYVMEVLEPQLGKKSAESKPEEKGGEKEGAGATSEKRIRQAVYDIRYRARREDVPLEQAFSQYMGHTSMNAVEKKEVKEKLGLGPSGGSVSEEVKDAKYQVRVKDKATGKSYVRYATREKINQLRANPNISSVEMTKYGTPYEGEKSRGEYTAKAKAGKGLDPVGREDKDIDNDGDHDKTDKYLLNRRKVRGAAIAKKTVKEGYSNWREDLREVVDDNITSEKKNEIKEKKVNNKVTINPKLQETIERMGGEVIEMVEVDEAVYGGEKKEPKDTRFTVTAADKKANTPAYQKLKAGDKKYKAAPHLGEETDIDEGMTMKDFKKQRSREKQKEKRAADKIAPGRRKDIHTDRLSPERAARHRANIDPDFEGNDERNYPGGKLKNPKKIRKAKALGELGEQTEIQEKALSRAQQKFMGMVYAAKKGETPASPEVAKAAAGMTKKAARDFAKTKHKGLPEVKEAMDSKIQDQPTPTDDKVRNSQSDAVKKQQIQNLKMMQQKRQMLDRQKLQMQRSGKLPIEASYQPEGEVIDERRKEDKVAGTPRNDLGKTDKAYRAVKQMMRGMSGKPAGQRKKVPGQKPPAAGQYGAPKSPAQKIALRRAAAKRSQDGMSSRFD